ncbi:MAG: DUF3105 domain-containing protein [Chloroflexota bacterium]
MSRRHRPGPSSTPRLKLRPDAGETQKSPDRVALRREAERSLRRRRQLRRYAFRAAAGLVGAAAVVLIALVAGVGQPELGREAAIEAGRNHIAQGAPLAQRNQPPSSGPHYASRASYGLSVVPIPPGNWIHALEHGGIVVLYQCADQGACESIGRELEGSVYRNATNGRFGEPKLVVTPYQDMPAPITAVAWGRTLELQSVDSAAILAFYDRYVDRGPENAQ